MFEKVTRALAAKGYEVRCFARKEEAADYLVENIRESAVGIGGSDSIRALDVYGRLCERNRVFWHWEGGKEMRALAAEAEIYLSSVNALAETGEFVNIDYTGNRTASLFYGHRQVFLVVGKNKLTPTLEAAVYRARNVAAPKNARRLGKNTPCAVRADRCYDCSSPERICCGLQIMLKPTAAMRFTIVLVDEELGF
jgi:hypothetical protein